MAAPAISARLKYLNDSAHLLAANAPGTSAYLMSRCNGLMFENQLDQSDAHRRHVCSACGNIMILGLTGTRHLGLAGAQRRKRNVTPKSHQLSNPGVKMAVYTCGKCGRLTRQSINTNIPRSSKASHIVHESKHSQATTLSRLPSSEAYLATKAPSSTLANATSRKRAKIRKHGGLQALLAKSKEAESTGSSGGFGLDLLDLMKKA